MIDNCCLTPSQGEFECSQVEEGEEEGEEPEPRPPVEGEEEEEQQGEARGEGEEGGSGQGHPRLRRGGEGLQQRQRARGGDEVAAWRRGRTLQRGRPAAGGHGHQRIERRQDKVVITTRSSSPP